MTPVTPYVLIPHYAPWKATISSHCRGSLRFSSALLRCLRPHKTEYSHPGGVTSMMSSLRLSMIDARDGLLADHPRTKYTVGSFLPHDLHPCPSIKYPSHRNELLVFCFVLVPGHCSRCQQGRANSDDVLQRDDNLT